MKYINTNSNQNWQRDNGHHPMTAEAYVRLREEMVSEVRALQKRLDRLEKFYQFVMAIHPEIYNEFRTCTQVIERLEGADGGSQAKEQR
jgi:hypothetical protein